jgi:hypothetical protein
LYKYGGLWLDADCLVQGKLKPLLEDLQNADWVVYADENEDFTIAIIAIRKDSPMLKLWIDQMNQKMIDQFDFKWTEIGYDILYPLWKERRKNEKNLWRVKIYRDTETCFPLVWNEWEQFFVEQPCDFLYRPNQPVIIFFNAMFPDWFKNLDEKSFVQFIDNSKTVIADLFRRSGY